MVADIRLRALVVRDMPIPRRSPDPKDDAILAAVVAGDAELVVSGDKPGILALREVEGIPICTPHEALQIALVPSATRSL